MLRIGIVCVMLSASIVLTTLPSRADPVHQLDIVVNKYAFEPQVIRVTAGEPVRLLIRSADVLHGFAIRDLKIKIEIPRGGAPVTVEFTAPPAGRYEITCSEFCGSGHGRMKATLVSEAGAQARP